MADVADEYRSSLAELSFNSKPHINMLTMIAEENIKHAPFIVQTIVDHVKSVSTDMMLPCMYLIDSIIKNIGKIYVQLFSKHIVAIFTSVFEKVDENVRSLLYKLRSTWTGIFPNALMLRLDRSVVSLDPAWPILAQPSKTIHVNPKFLDKSAAQVPKKEEAPSSPSSVLLQEANEIKKKQLEVLKVLQAKKEQLLELKRKASATVVSEYLGADVQKVLSARDPRLSRKEPVTDAVTLQSVVVVPKALQAADKKNDVTKEKGSLSPEPKRRKIDAPEPDIQTDLRNKLNDIKNSTTVLEQNLNKDKILNFDNQSKRKQLSVNTDNVPPSKKDNKIKVSESESDRLELKRNIQPIDKESFNHVGHKREVIPPEGLRDRLKLNVKQKEDPYKNSHRLEPPIESPVLFGNEDKDYRILIPQNHDSDERVKDETIYPKRVPVPVVKTFKLDNKDRKIYFVDNRSFVVMDDNIPRELTFDGPPKLIFVEGLPKPFELGFGGHEVKFEIDGKWNTIKLGTPSREIYVNNYPYEAQFGGQPFIALLESGKLHRFHISGPAPQVILSEMPAFDLYEKFCQSNQEFLRNFDNHHCDVAPDVQQASMDVDMRVSNNKFASTIFNFPLEKVNDVDWTRMPVGDSPQTTWDVSQNYFETSKDENPNFVAQRNFPEVPPDFNRNMLPPNISSQNENMPAQLPPKQLINSFPAQVNVPFPSSDCPTSIPPNSNMTFSQPNYSNAQIPQFNEIRFANTPKLTPPPLPPFLPPIPNSTCVTTTPFINTVVTAPMPLTSLEPMTSLAPPPMPPSMPRPSLLPTPSPSLSNSIQIAGLPEPVQVTSAPALPVASTAPPVNMDIFLEKLIAAGIIGGKKSASPTPESEKIVEEKEEPIKEVPIPEIVFVTRCLKVYHRGVINQLHTGSQCATCGMRFKEIQSEQYSRHLDWHFRMNRREKDGAKKPFSRRLFYEIKDWIEFKEFEEVDERAPSYFELQASGEQPAEEVPETLCSVPSTECESETCAVCSEQFQLFWVEEEEEWHLRNAVKHDDQVYHPACYEDFKKANEANESMNTEASESMNTDLDTSVEDSTVKTESEKMDDDSPVSPTKSENKEPETAQEEEKKPEISETGPIIKVKEEVIDKTEPSPETQKGDAPVDDKSSAPVEDKANTDIAKDEKTVTVSESEPVKDEGTMAKSSPNEIVPIKTEEEEEIIEFRPPTPDPRFQVLAPVTKGTELSALCSIM